MSDPFLPISAVGTPVWTTQATSDGNFASIQVGGATSIPEVGYGEGGYGEGGYDTPTINFPAAPTPNWTVETTQ